MKLLSNNKFKEALNSLEVISEVGMVRLMDEEGEVAKYNTSNGTHEINDSICIFDDEHTMSDIQKDMLYDVLILEVKQNEISENRSQPMDWQDRQNAINVIYN